MLRRVSIVVLALVVILAGVKGFIDYSNEIYYRGAEDAVQAMNKAHRTIEAHEKGKQTGGKGSGTYAVHEGSPSVTYGASGGYDISTMNPYDHQICDYTTNFREGISIAYNGASSSAKLARDNDGSGGSCNHNNLPFRGAYHQACLWSIGGCDRVSAHRKAKRR